MENKGKVLKAVTGVLVIAIGIYVGMAAWTAFPLKKKSVE